MSSDMTKQLHLSNRPLLSSYRALLTPTCWPPTTYEKRLQNFLFESKCFYFYFLDSRDFDFPVGIQTISRAWVPACKGQQYQLINNILTMTINLV